MNRLFIATLSSLLACIVSATAELSIPKDPMWVPIVDDVYLQEIPLLIPAKESITSVAVLNNIAYAGSQSGLKKVDGDSLVAI